ncbi:NAD(P)H-dependent oxidoreductase [Salininema proteolyticum]|uniref:NAD(P)H-dependent oxidoreductase n=1 Tax=Salininema proteolyticum TaxID=1607685 RepID=A0ABV8U013_9ACTN
MTTPVKVAVLAGSLRKDSHSTSVLRAALNRFAEDIDATWIDNLDRLPAFNEDHEAEPGAEVAKLREAVAGADAVFAATPEYNGLLPGHLKTALDWVSRPYANGVIKGKPAAGFGASPSPNGGLWAVESLHRAYTVAGAAVVGEPTPIAASPEATDEAGALAREEDAAKLDGLLRDLVAAARS